MRRLLRAALVILFSGLLTAVASAAHPFLLVKAQEYDHIRSLTSQNPWLVMKNRVLRDSTGGSAPILFNPGDDYPSKCTEAWGLISANSMAYIYDPANSATYKNTLVAQMNIILDDLASRPDPAGWTENVSLGNVLFSSILALDIIYNDLTPGEISTLEGRIGPLVGGLVSTSWELSPYAVKGLWALYSGDTNGFNSYRQLYTQEVDAELSPDGVPRIGNGYLIARFLGSSREQKALFMDVLEYQGYHDFYTDARVRNAHEYLFGYSTTPFGRAIPFGDSSQADILRENNNAQLWRACRFGEKAGSYAEWQTGSLWPQGRLTSGLLIDQAVTLGRFPPSRIFTDGGAFFHEKNQSPNALCGALWNVNTSSGHAHKDINALALSGYGQHLLVNSGYCGYGTGALNYGWDYINNTAYSGNTLRTDGMDHAGKAGAGITEGFIADKLDYACGNAGSALYTGTHYRSLLFIQPVPESGVNGYWTVFDDVTASSYCLSTFHPNSTSNLTVTANMEYESLISAATTTMSYGGDVRLTTFLGTAPVSVTEKDGLIAAWDNQSFIARYLEVRHNLSSGKKQICTVLFPSDALHPKAALTRLAGTGYSGVSVVQGSCEDLNIESSTNENVLAKCRFKAGHSWSRFKGNQLLGYFATKATKFLDTALTAGFVSDQPVTIHLYGDVGKVIATQTTTVTIYSTNLPGGSTNLLVQPGESQINFGDPKAIYTDEFDGAGVPLHGTTPTTGGERWIANSIVTDAGVLTADAGSAVLPFDPVTNQCYTVSLDFNYSSGSGGWLGLGFTTTPPTAAALPNANDRFSGVNVPGYAWMICNGSSISGVWEGGRTTNAIAYASPPPAAGPHTLKIVLDTTGNGSNFTANFFIDGTPVTGGPKIIDAITVQDINYVGFTQYGSGLLAGSTVTHFSLVNTNFAGFVQPVTNTGDSYTEAFNGAGGAFNGKTTTTGGGIWSANSIVTDNGVLTASAGSALLPFAPVTNQTYTLAMDFNYSSVSGGWFGLGFASATAVNAPGASSTADRFNNANVPGYAWMFCNVSNIGGVYQGGRTTNAIAYTSPKLAAGSHTLKIILDTTGNGSSFKADFLVDNTSVTGGPTTINVALSVIKSVGFTQYGGGLLTGSTVDNFSLVRGGVSPGVAPTLSYASSSGSLVFNWTGSGFKLQMQTNNSLTVGLSTNWVDVPGGGISGVSVPVTTRPSAFFRLIATPP